MPGAPLPSTGKMKAFKLLSVAGAYWRGDQQQPDAAADLRHRLCRRSRSWRSICKRLEEAKERDHRKLGKELKIFTSPKKSAKDCPSGCRTGRRCAARSNGTSSIWRKVSGYQHVYTPYLANVELYKISRPLGSLPGKHVSRR